MISKPYPILRPPSRWCEYDGMRAYIGRAVIDVRGVAVCVGALVVCRDCNGTGRVSRIVFNSYEIRVSSCSCDGGYRGS